MGNPVVVVVVVVELTEIVLDWVGLGEKTDATVFVDYREGFCNCGGGGGLSVI